MKRLIVPALGLGLALALQGCSVGGTDEPAPTVTVTASPTTSTPSNSANVATEQSPTAPAESTSPKDAVTTAYEASQRTVFTLDASQVSAFTGLDFNSAEHSDLAAKLSEQSRWDSQPNTKKYAQLIAEAMDRENKSAQNALREMSQDDRAKLRIYVSHNQHATVAHIGVTHDDK